MVHYKAQVGRSDITIIITMAKMEEQKEEAVISIKAGPVVERGADDAKEEVSIGRTYLN